MMGDDQNIRPITKTNRTAVTRVDSLNFIKFKKLVAQYGYPSEKLIGARCSDNRKFIAPQPQQILLMHFYLHKYFDLDTIIQQLVKKLLIKPEEYATYSDFISAPNKRCNIDHIVEIDKKYYTYIMSDSLKIVFRNNREAICLFSIDEQIKKMKFRQHNNLRGFRIPQYS